MHPDSTHSPDDPEPIPALWDQVGERVAEFCSWRETNGLALFVGDKIVVTLGLDGAEVEAVETDTPGAEIRTDVAPPGVEQEAQF